MSNPLKFILQLAAKLFNRKPAAVAHPAAPPASSNSHSPSTKVSVSRPAEAMLPGHVPGKATVRITKKSAPQPTEPAVVKTIGVAPPFTLDSLRWSAAGSLKPSDIHESAGRLGVSVAAVLTVLKVESNGGGFAPDGRPIILFEPHKFSKATGGVFDQSHPTISYKVWKTRPYPKTQDARWKQLYTAYALDPEAALASASWGLFQVMGFNYAMSGCQTVYEFVQRQSRSEVSQLVLFEAFLRKAGLVPAMKALDWETFARHYNGPGAVEIYSRLLAQGHDWALKKLAA